MRLTLASAVQPDRATATNRPILIASVPPPAATPVALPVEPPAKTAPTPPLAAAPAPAPAPPAPPLPSAKDLAFAELRLQSIFYSKRNPSAIINGLQVRPQDTLPAGARVVAIGPSSVILEFEKERKTLALE